MEVRVLKYLDSNKKGKPNEDFLIHKPHIYAVGDGCTLFVPHGKDYPTLSPARAAAEIFCVEVANFLGSSPSSIREAFRRANKAIRWFNISRGITKETTDYLENDFAGCVGALGVLLDNTLAYGYIGDCGLMIFDESLFPALFTQNDIVMFEQLRDVWGFSSTEERKLLWNKTLRNRPEARYLTYGVLNGEEEALSYVRTGVVELRTGDTAVLFSDGMFPYLFDRSVRGAIAKVLGSDMEEGEKREVVVQAISSVKYGLIMHGFKNLDDDKACIAFQLV